MKIMTLTLLSGLGAALVSSSPASAAFVGLKAVSKPVPAGVGLYVCNVYAVFDRPDDFLVAVAGTPDSPLDIHVIGGKFYQDPQGNPLTPPTLELLPGDSGMLEYDTFVTIGLKTDTALYSFDDVYTTPGLAFENDRIATNAGAWFFLLMGETGGPGSPDENGQVLLFQGSFFLGSGARGIAGQMLVQFGINGDPTPLVQYVSFSHIIPAPGALMMFGLSRLAGIRRRRR